VITIQTAKTITKNMNITSGIIKVSPTYVVNLAAAFEIAIANFIFFQRQIIINKERASTPQKM
jgi:hypothetical protein